MRRVACFSYIQFPREEIYGLQRTFVMYVRFPKERWPEIRRAEALTPEGDAAWTRLRDEFLATYFQEPEPRIDRINDRSESEPPAKLSTPSSSKRRSMPLA
jgi:hypothetical protein